jgi:hypothetical protein
MTSCTLWPYSALGLSASGSPRRSWSVAAARSQSAPTSCPGGAAHSSVATPADVGTA